MPLPRPPDDFSDSSTEDSFLLYKNMQRIPNIPLPVFKKPSRRVFPKISPSVARVRKSMISHLMLPRKKSLISSTPRNPSCKTPVSQDSPLQLSPIKARAKSILAGNFDCIKQTQNVLIHPHPKLNFSSNEPIELRLSKSYDTQPIKKVKQINTSVRNVVEHLNREMLKKKRKSIGKLVQRNSNGVLKENVTLANQISVQSGSSSADSGKVSDTMENKPPTTLQSRKTKPVSLRKTDVMERETQTTDSLNKGSPKPSIVNKNQNSNKKSVTLKNSSENAVNDPAIQEILEQWDADVAVDLPSIITISSSTENMSPYTTSNRSQEPPEPTNQNSYNNNNIIFDADPKIRNVTMNKENYNGKNSSQLNVSHNTRSFQINSMTKANDDKGAKEGKRSETKINSNHNQKQLESANSLNSASPTNRSARSRNQAQSANKTLNETPGKSTQKSGTKANSNHNRKQLENAYSLNNKSPNNRSTRSRNQSQSADKSLNETAGKSTQISGTKANSNHNQKQLENAYSLNSENTNNRSTRSRNLSQYIDKSLNETARNSNTRFKNEGKLSNSAAAENKPTSREKNTENKEKSTNTSEITKTRRQSSRKTLNRNYNYSEWHYSPAAVKKSRQRKTKSKISKSRRGSSRNSTVLKEDKKLKDSKRISTAVTRKSKASTSKIMNFQPYFYNRVSGFVQIEQSHPTLNFIDHSTEGDRKSERRRRPPAHLVQCTFVGSAQNKRRTRSIRQSTAQQPSRIETSAISELTNTNNSNLETGNSDVFKKPLVRSSSKRLRKPRNNDISDARKKLKSITSSVDITENETNQTDGTSLSKNHDFTETVDSGTHTMCKEISSRTVTVRSSPGPSRSYRNNNVALNSILPEQSGETVGSISQEQLQEMPENSLNVAIRENVVQPLTGTTPNLNKTVIEVASQISASVPKPVKGSVKKSVTFNEAFLQTSRNALAKVLFPTHNNEPESSRRLPDFDDDVQHDGGKEKQHKENVNAEELDQNTVYTMINNEVLPVEWISKKPQSSSLKSSEGVTVTYILKNLRTMQGTMSHGLITFDPGQHRVQVTKKHSISYKVEQGEAIVNLQLQKRNVGVGYCFHIPLGSTYSITNLSQVAPLVLFFTKVSAS